MSDSSGDEMPQYCLMNRERTNKDQAQVGDRHLFRIVAWIEQASPPRWRGWVWHIDSHAQTIMRQSAFDDVEGAFDIIREQLGTQSLPGTEDE
ncbi:hypothetical protein [Rhizobium leguminosarum]